MNQPLKTQKKFYKLFNKTQSVLVFLDRAKFADFQWKNADASRNQVVCHMTYESFGSSLGKLYLCQVSTFYDMCSRL